MDVHALMRRVPHILIGILIGVLIGALISAPAVDAAARRSVASRLAALERRVKALERPLTTDTPMELHWHSPGTTGPDLLPHEHTTLGMFVQSGDDGADRRIDDFGYAFEADLLTGGMPFHLTHEVIDEKTW
jgi:hypothetical protein